MNNLLPSLIYDVPFIVEPVVYLAPGITHAALHISCTALGSGGDGRGFGTQAGNLFVDLLIERYSNLLLTIEFIRAAVHIDVNALSLAVARAVAQAGHVLIYLTSNRVIIAAGL